MDDMRYADPTLCPDCRSALPRGVPTCPTCRLAVRHPLAVGLFGTLQTADSLLAELRALSDQRMGAPMPTGPAVAPSPQPLPAQLGSGVRFASVPKILLGLGAFCLLAAAIIFLAVSWSTLGVGGRTAVLGGFTLAEGAAALLLHRVGLRVAGEALVVVALGLLGLDVLGANASGWFGDPETGVVAAIAGGTLGVAGLLLGLARIGGQPRLVAPQLIAALGLVTTYLGLVGATDHRLLVGHALTALAVVLVVLANRVQAPALLWAHTVVASLAWAGTAGTAFADSLADPDLKQLWVAGSGWSLVVAGALLLVPGVVSRRRNLLLAGASGAALLVTVAVTLPCVDTEPRTVGLVSLVVTAGWVLALGVLPRSLHRIAIAPSAVGSLILGGLALVTATVAFDRWISLADSETGQAFGHPADVALRHPDTFTEPLLTVPSLLVVVGFLALLAPNRDRAALGSWLRVATVVAGTSLAVTLASYDLALAWSLAALALTALVAAGLALVDGGTRGVAMGAVAVALAGGAGLGAVPSSPLMLGLAGLALVVGLGLAVGAPERGTRFAGGLAVAPYLALTIGALLGVLDTDAGWLAVPVLLAAGIIALALPRVEIEVSAILTALVTLSVSLAATYDAGGLAALWLTVAGSLACGTALLHQSRRRAAWAGSALLVLASWVRLADLEVSAPEPYTLPLAVALLGFGVWRIRRDPAIGTTEALLPGLLLATAPSLAWVLVDPVSLRALLLGAACLTLTVAGAAMRWSAPLVTGATVGAILVLREIGAYPGEIPKWVWIGLAGTLLIVLGVTWERRLLEMRRAVGYLGRLR